MASFSKLIRWAFIFAVAFSASFLIVTAVRQTQWHKNRLLHRLLTGDPPQRITAATALAQLGAEPQLLEALKAKPPAVHQLARRALDFVWFSRAGEEAYRITTAAYEAAEKKRFADAITLLNEVVVKYPNFAEGWNRRAAVHWQTGDYTNAFQDCRRALALNPNHYAALQGIGVCELKFGHVKKACEALRSALRIAPHDQSTQDCLRQCEELLRPSQPRHVPENPLTWL